MCPNSNFKLFRQRAADIRMSAAAGQPSARLFVLFLWQQAVWTKMSALHISKLKCLMGNEFFRGTASPGCCLHLLWVLHFPISASRGQALPSWLRRCISLNQTDHSAVSNKPVTLAEEKQFHLQNKVQKGWYSINKSIVFLTLHIVSKSLCLFLFNYVQKAE